MGTARLDIGWGVKTSEGIHNIFNRRLVDGPTAKNARDVNAERRGRSPQQHQSRTATDAINDRN